MNGTKKNKPIITIIPIQRFSLTLIILGQSKKSTEFNPIETQYTKKL